ncbi:MAG: hypothetical protein A2722_03715 [Candidatus Doudnabacteria bacterium RIFCSPHIGHO2_01_FULL_50_11]|uniref:Endonuclease/exonuclease/phosphatase domain-containing protein n=1 Tax=Candidatus Doudnabacteria bacterium RIFCSPHIGHO2_01_FULL_50_11 TaxID=1817828 RepID=A0A1F5PIY2_9BACT|nr:MAG: hypothetical protein A2722_03715 [Candidatus Doudnabacteria bacterium RIFCSPHIGHO2_01_FULL_50_11]HLC44613.1 endonuclease/exonuclease/phosphatase family protein [Patescibacteria group bacterium]
MSHIKLITINVERDKHWDRIIPFLEHEQADVVCMQELFERDLAMLSRHFGYQSVYIPITKHGDSKSVTSEGPSLLTTLPLTNIHREYYYKTGGSLQIENNDSVEALRKTIHQGVVWGTVEKDGIQYTIASTHFTWSPEGQPNSYQEQDAQALLKILDRVDELVLCGDFNAPRGYNHIYDKLCKRFKDNIPETLKTTLDVDLHYARRDLVQKPRISKYVVDYVFSTPAYSVRNVHTQFGVSDHCAIVCEVEATNPIGVIDE